MREAQCSCGQLRVTGGGRAGADLHVPLLRLPAPDRQRVLDAGALPEGAGAGGGPLLGLRARERRGRRGADVPLLPRLRLDRLLPDRPGADRRPDRQLRRSHASRRRASRCGRRPPASLGHPARRRGAQRRDCPTSYGSARAARPSPAVRRACGRPPRPSARAGAARRRAPSPSGRSRRGSGRRPSARSRVRRRSCSGCGAARARVGTPKSRIGSRRRSQSHGYGWSSPSSVRSTTKSTSSGISSGYGPP